MNEKSPVVAYLLWFFLGGFGAHRMYMGKIGSGIGMAALTVGSIVLSAIVIGLLGFPILFGWLVVDAFLLNKWLKGEQGAMASAAMEMTGSPLAGRGPAPEAAPEPVSEAA